MGLVLLCDLFRQNRPKIFFVIVKFKLKRVFKSNKLGVNKSRPICGDWKVNSKNMWQLHVTIEKKNLKTKNKYQIPLFLRKYLFIKSLKYLLGRLYAVGLFCVRRIGWKDFNARLNFFFTNYILSFLECIWYKFYGFYVRLVNTAPVKFWRCEENKNVTPDRLRFIVVSWKEEKPVSKGASRLCYLQLENLIYV